MPNYHGQKALVIPKLVNITMIIFQTTFHADCDDRPVDMEEHDIGIQQNLILIYCIKRLCCVFNMYVLFHTQFQCMCSSPEKGRYLTEGWAPELLSQPSYCCLTKPWVGT